MSASFEFIVVRCQAIGNPEIGYSLAYMSDLQRKASVEQAIVYGFRELDHDDFLIGKVDGDHLLSLQWMEEVRDDRDELADCAGQLCLKVAQ